MPSPEISIVGPGEAEWVVVDQQWWRTPFETVSWEYKQGERRRRVGPLSSLCKTPTMDSQRVSRQAFLPVGSTRHRTLRGLDDGENTMLNPELIGVKAAVDSISPYETSVGFHYVAESLTRTHAEFQPPSADLLCSNASEEDIQRGRQLWKEFAEKLTGGGSSSEPDTDGSCNGDLSPMSSSGGLHSSTSTLSSIDISSLDIPLTPRATSVINVVIKDSPIVDNDLPSQASSRLNATASTFVPSFGIGPKSLFTPPDDKFPLPSLQDFTFPSIDRPTSVKIIKDEQGFVTDVEVEDSKSASPLQQEPPSSVLLPSFLGEPSPSRRKTSKTRALVDKLRSSVVSECDKPNWITLGDKDRLPDPRAKSANISPSPSPFELVDFFKRLSVSEDGGDTRERGPLEPDEEGWFTFTPEQRPDSQPVVQVHNITKDVPKTNAHDKAQRAQALFLALNRHREVDENQDPSTHTHSEAHDETMSQSTGRSQPSCPPTPADHSAPHTSRADSRASSTSSKKRSKRATPSHQQQHFHRPLSISIPHSQPTYTPVIPISSMAPLPYSSQYPHQSIGVVPYMQHHPQTYLGVATPMNPYLQMQMQLQLQMQAGLVHPPSVRPSAGGDWITPGRPPPTLAPSTKPGQHHPTPSSLESSYW